MLEAIKKIISDFSVEEPEETPEHTRLQLAEAALMFHVIAIDGEVTDDERSRMTKLLSKQFGMAEDETHQLIDEAKEAEHAAIDLYGFTSTLKHRLNDHERETIVENLWEMVYADGVVHELEDNVVWRIAELLHVDSKARMAMKRRVSRRLNSPE